MGRLIVTRYSFPDTSDKQDDETWVAYWHRKRHEAHGGVVRRYEELTAQMADDRGVHQGVQRLGRDRAERGEAKRDDAPVQLTMRPAVCRHVAKFRESEGTLRKFQG